MSGGAGAPPGAGARGAGQDGGRALGARGRGGAGAPPGAGARVACLDVGSTFTKGALVAVPGGALLATAQAPTSAGADVLHGVDAVLGRLGAGPGDEVLACSSAGGGLRLAVVGYERAVTAEAGHRVGLTAGARVVHVAAGPLGPAGVAALVGSRPDVVLLAGGTDGGNAEVLLHNARALASGAPGPPVVVAGNADARDEAAALLIDAGVAAIPTANVLPRIGRLDPRPAREAIRGVFIRHVIGGKGLSRGPRFPALVRAATPDAVLAGVELLADGAGGVPGAGDVLVVDVGGATTDVYSVLTPEPQDAALRWEVVAPAWRARTVEGDLGVRWNAPGVVEAARSERLLGDAEAPALRAAAARRAADPAYLPAGDTDRDVDVRLGALAVTVALRRHARPAEEDGVRRGGRDLRAVALVVGSGGVFRHADAGRRARMLAPATEDAGGGWRAPEAPAAGVDARGVLAAAGLLAPGHPEAGARLLRAHLPAPERASSPA